MFQKALVTALFLCINLFISAQYIEIGPYSGAVSDSSAVIVYKLSLPDQECRVEYSKDSLFRGSYFSKTYVTSGVNANYIKVALKNLEPGTKYFYQLELNGQKLERSRGKFKTFSGNSASFSFAFGNSLKSESRRSGLKASLDKNIMFFLHTGDLHYDNIDVADIGLFRNSYQKALLRKDMSALGKETPLIYMWDDHDYGPNNSDKTAAGRLQSGKAYRECIPHYPLRSKEENGAIYQAFTVNNVRFIMTDLRSKRDRNKQPDNDQKTMMGEEQRAWFFEELKKSAANHPLVIWVSSVPYTAEKRTDSWAGFTYERRLIANFIKKHNINNVMIISGDAHSIAYNDGTNNNYSDYPGEGLFEILAAPLDNWATSKKGGPWTGSYIPDDGQLVYGMVEVDYTDNKAIVNFKAFDTKHQKVIEAEKHFNLIRN
ncbi:MAG TPA: alkaline phosphatase D family protein [Bacteroidales bacterium]|nr:alkaline phosphatase D family protein [Bacteroidales bacterium]